MTENQASVVADAIGGEAWQSGGSIWLMLRHKQDGGVVAISAEVVCEYSSALAFGAQAAVMVACIIPAVTVATISS